MVYIMAFFQDVGIPATGLSPTITIRRVDTNEIVVNATPMSEIGGGHYKYNFTTFNMMLDYCWTIDAGGDLAQCDRYKFGNSNEMPWILDMVRKITRD
jgi:hypothetical protein